jgi:hypothetical protein
VQKPGVAAGTPVTRNSTTRRTMSAAFCKFRRVLEGTDLLPDPPRQRGSVSLLATSERARPQMLSRRRVIQGKPRWSANLVMAAAIVSLIGMQLLLLSPMVFHPWWLWWVLPALEALLLVALIVNPRQLDRESPLLRAAILVLIAVINLVNAWLACWVMGGMIHGSQDLAAGALLTAGAVMWYWELERDRPYPDFLFTQMQSPDLAPPGWEPAFSDYVYLSFTNATAFSPTDVLPLSRWAKLTMMFQAIISFSTVVLVIARAVNILN